MKLAAIILALLISGESAPTSGTLRIEQLFAVPGKPAPKRLDDGLMIELPDLETWKAPPTPVATPTPTVVALPSFPTLMPGNKGEIRFGELPFLADEGRVDALAGTDLAEIVLRTEFDDMCARYEIVAEDGETSSVVTLHAGEFSETFRIPAGRYRIEREAWMRTARRPSTTTEFPPQNIQAGSRYMGVSDERAERAARETLRFNR